MRLALRRQVPGAWEGVSEWTAFGWLVLLAIVIGLGVESWRRREDLAALVPDTVFQRQAALLEDLIEEVRALRQAVEVRGSEVEVDPPAWDLPVERTTGSRRPEVRNVEGGG